MSTQGNKPTRIKIGIRIFVNHVSGERLWEIDKPIPPQMQIALNVNVLGIEKRSDETLDAPFVFTVNFTPSIAQINIKGKAQASGDRNEINKILLEYELLEFKIVSSLDYRSFNFFNIQTIFFPKFFAVSLPSSSSLTCSLSLPKEIFQYVEPGTIIP